MSEEAAVVRYAEGLLVGASGCVRQVLVTHAGDVAIGQRDFLGCSEDVVRFMFRSVDGVEPATRNILPWRRQFHGLECVQGERF